MRSPRFLNRPDSASKSPRSGVLDFVEVFDAFCDVWGLNGMVSWNLPDPRGPLLGTPTALQVAQTPGQAVHLSIPPAFPFKDSDFNAISIRHQQEALLKEQGSRLAGVSAHITPALGEVLAIDHSWRVITGRYFPEGISHGYVQVIERALAQALQVKPDRIRQLRKYLAAALQGQRPCQLP